MKVDNSIVTGMAWGMPLFLVTIFMVGAPETVGGLRMIMSGMVFLVIGAVFLIQHTISLSALKGQEKMLEIEYRLAELTELVKLERGEQPAA